MKTRWKFLRLDGNKIKSDNGDLYWKIGEWKHEDNIKMCKMGFHCSKKIYQALNYISGNVLALVEVKGKSDVGEDKEVYSDMRIVKAYHWTKKDSVELAVYGAELCLPYFEKAYPEDKRPREAIKAAKRWLQQPTDKNAKLSMNAALTISASQLRLRAKRAAQSAQSAAFAAAVVKDVPTNNAALAIGDASIAMAVDNDDCVYSDDLRKRYFATLQSFEDWLQDHIQYLKSLT
jgi:uncharacterized protein YneR